MAYYYFDDLLNKTINNPGTSSDQVNVKGEVRSSRINLGDGMNSIYLGLSGSAPSTPSARANILDLSVTGGSDFDLLNINANRVSHFTYRPGDGINALEVSAHYTQLHYAGGAGSDQITFKKVGSKQPYVAIENALLELGNGNNHVSVEAKWVNKLRITGGSDRDSIAIVGESHDGNGSAPTTKTGSPIFLSGMNLGAGDDLITIIAGDLRNSYDEIAGDRPANMITGLGNDTIRLLHTSMNNIAISLEAGNDSINLTNCSVYNSSISTGDGNDMFDSSFDSYKASLAVNSDFSFGDGADTIYLLNINMRDCVVDTGAGNDVIRFNRVHNTSIYLGDGDDYFVESSIGAYNMYIDAGTGNDTLTLDDTIDTSVLTGDGNDELRSKGIINSTVDMGTGNDTVYIDIALTTDSSIRGGAGTDSLALRAISAGQDITIGNSSSGNLSGFEYIETSANATRELITIDFDRVFTDHQIETTYSGRKALYIDNGIEDLIFLKGANFQPQGQFGNYFVYLCRDNDSGNSMYVMMKYGQPIANTSKEQYLATLSDTLINKTINYGSANDTLDIRNDTRNSTINLGSGNNSAHFKSNAKINYSDTHIADTTIQAGSGNDTVFTYLSTITNSTIHLGEGNNTVDLSTNTAKNLSYTGGNGNDKVAIKGLHPYFLTIYGIDGAKITLGNGDNDLYMVSRVIKDLNITSGTGADSIRIYGNDQGLRYSPATIFLKNMNSGAGNDIVEIIGDIHSGFAAQKGALRTGNGNDTCTIYGSVEQMQIDTGANDDLINLHNSSAIRNIIMDSEIIANAGNDTVNVHTEARSTTFDLGKGNDVLLFTEAIAESTINADAGHDSVALNRSNDTTVILGDGNDTMTINNPAYELQVDAGNHNDIIIANGSLIHSSVNLGSGNDSFASNDALYYAQIHGGTGADTMTLNVSYIETSSLSGGAGIDLLAIHAEDSLELTIKQAGQVQLSGFEYIDIKGNSSDKLTIAFDELFKDNDIETRVNNQKALFIDKDSYDSIILEGATFQSHGSINGYNAFYCTDNDSANHFYIMLNTGTLTS